MIFARQYNYQNCNLTPDGFIDENSCYVPFWNTRTGVIVKWSLFLAFIVFISLYLLIGHIHARKRVQKGLAPLAYHRFLVPRSTLAQVDPRFRYPQPNITSYRSNGQQIYDMHAMPPPPVYDPNAARPPMYEPPAGATKTDANQQYQPPQYGVAAAPSSQYQQPPASYAPFEYAPPQGPPPLVSSSAQTPLETTFVPPPGPPPAAATVQPQGTGNTNNPFRS